MIKRIIKIFLVIVLIIGVLTGVLFVIPTNFDEIRTPLQFPADHGLHYTSSEWLYFTGVVETTEGKELGYEFTIFQAGSRYWLYRNHFYVGHAAVSDPDIPKHFLAETISNLYSVDVEREKADIKIEDFSYRYSEKEGFEIKTETNGIKFDLKLKPQKKLLLHGEDGVIKMGDGKDSAYYSFTNLNTKGTIAYNGKTHEVKSGRTWMDHQWGNYKKPGMHWDWFSLRFDDGGSLMVFHLRGDNDKKVQVNWTYRAANGSIKYGYEAFIEAGRKWRDDPGKATYPLDWQVRIPELDAEIYVKPLFDAQSIHDVLTPSYWEGICSVKGNVAKKKLKGSGYVELTFYDD